MKTMLWIACVVPCALWACPAVRADDAEDVAALRAKLAEARQIAADTAKLMSAVQQQNDALRKQVTGLQADLANQTELVNGLRETNRVQEKSISDFMLREARLGEQVQELTLTLSELRARDAVSRWQIVYAVPGRVEAVAGEALTIQLAGRADVKIGDNFLVYREGRLLGVAIIERIGPKELTGRLTMAAGEVHVADRVVAIPPVVSPPAPQTQPASRPAAGAAAVAGQIDSVGTDLAVASFPAAQTVAVGTVLYVFRDGQKIATFTVQQSRAGSAMGRLGDVRAPVQKGDRVSDTAEPPPPAARLSTAQGEITAVQGEMASISLGSEDGVKPGMQFYVHRGDQFVATFVAQDVVSNQTVGPLINAASKAQAGDTVTPKPAEP
jgi:hypothetical protein